MTFYLKPSEGSIPTNLFHTFAEVRLRYLAGLRQFENGSRLLPARLIQHADCLIEGTVKDRVSHFALRSVAVLEPSLHAFVHNKELILFAKRLHKMTYKELEHSLIIVIRQLKEYQQFDLGESKSFKSIREVFRSILKSRCLKHISNHCASSSISSSCQIIVKVPFTHVLQFIAAREVVLCEGMAILQCHQIPVYLTQVFGTLLEYTTRRIKETPILQRISEDPRFQEMLTSLGKIFTEVVPLQRTLLEGATVALANLDEISKHFPPCMRAIHHTLRTRHRLCHRPRVQYTLFLKEIGLPSDDFLKLLQIEYSRPAVQTGQNQKHKCEHSWGSDSRRYKYGTRHLYGLEGGRKNYSSHSCRTIQRETPGPNECGGCPFAHFDGENMKRFLAFDLEGKENADSFQKQINTDTILPIESCHMHLRFKLTQLVQLNSQLQDPSTQDVRTLENSQVKAHSVLKPKHYYAVISKFTMINK